MKVKSVIVPSGMEHLTKFTRKIPSDVNVVPVTNDDSFSNIPLKILHPSKKGRGKMKIQWSHMVNLD